MTPSWISPLWAHAVKFYWILCVLQLCVLQLTFTIYYVPGRSTCCCISSTDSWLMNLNHPHFTDVGNAAREVKYHAHAHTARSGQNSCAGLCVWLKKNALFVAWHCLKIFLTLIEGLSCILSSNKTEFYSRIQYSSQILNTHPFTTLCAEEQGSVSL